MNKDKDGNRDTLGQREADRDRRGPALTDIPPPPKRVVRGYRTYVLSCFSHV